MAEDMEMYPYGPGSHAPLADKREMPTCHPIKGNRNSMKYHRPDSQGYSNTLAEVWFDSPTAAEAAGFVLAGGHSAKGRREDYEPGGSGHPCTVEAVNAARVAMGGVAGTFTSTSGSTTVDGVAGVSGDMPDMDAGGVSGKAAAAGAAGVAGAAGLAASAKGKLSGDMPDMPDVPDMPNADISAPDINTPDIDTPNIGGGISGKAAAAGAVGAAGVAGVAGKASAATGKVTASASAAGDRVSAGKASIKGGAAAGSVGELRGTGNFDDDDDDDGGGIMGCLGKYWWLAALVLGILVIGLLLSQCGTGGDDADTAATPVASTAVSYTHLTLPTICSV